MKKSLCGRILQAGVIGSALALLMLAGRFLPMYMRHITDVRPELSGWYSWGILLVGYWRCRFSTRSYSYGAYLPRLAGGEVFSVANAGRFAQIWKLAALDTGLVALLGLVLILTQTTPPFLMIDGINAAVRRRVELGCVLCFKRADAKRSYDARGK